MNVVRYNWRWTCNTNTIGVRCWLIIIALICHVHICVDTYSCLFLSSHTWNVSHTSHSCIFSQYNMNTNTYIHTHILDRMVLSLCVYASAHEIHTDQYSTVFIDDIGTEIRIYKLVVSKITFLHLHSALHTQFIREKRRKRQIKKRENHL